MAPDPQQELKIDRRRTLLGAGGYKTAALARLGQRVRGSLGKSGEKKDSDGGALREDWGSEEYFSCEGGIMWKRVFL